MSQRDQSNMALAEDQLNTLFRYAMALCGQRDDALDIFQSSIEKYLIQIQKYSAAISSPEAYVRTLIRNNFYDAKRTQQRWQFEDYADHEAIDISPQTLDQVHINQQELKNVWSQLQAQDRDILYHLVILGFSTDETCTQLDIPRGTLLSRVHRLRKKLSSPTKLSPQKETMPGAIREGGFHEQ